MKRIVSVVDDDIDITRLFHHVLRENIFDASVLAFNDPISALEHFTENSEGYALVISDLRMPGMNGFEFVREARKINPKVKVLLMTAFEIDYREFARVLPNPKIDGLIHKPISIRKLNGLIKSYMELNDMPYYSGKFIQYKLFAIHPYGKAK